MKNILLVIITVIFCITNPVYAQSEWISLFNGKDLTGWFARGAADWYVQDSMLVGEGGLGHIYTDVIVSDFEVKGMFRISGDKTNSGFYFRASPSEDDPDRYPIGYEAQICHNHKAPTGWLWKPAKPTGEAIKVLTKDDEWFTYNIQAIGEKIKFWINGEMIMKYEDDEFKSGHFAIQVHNPGMRIEAKELYYRDLAK